MVAELPFGFWVSLLGKGIDYETRLFGVLRYAGPSRGIGVGVDRCMQT